MINKSFVNCKEEYIKENSNKSEKNIFNKSKEIENEKEEDSEIDDYESMNDL